MFNDTLRPSINVNYPSYHNGYYLEEFYYFNYKDTYSKNYIDIFWTNIYCNKYLIGKNIDIDEYLYKLDINNLYFTICQNDDGVLEKMPPKTYKFFAGGNFIDDKTIPIPLLSSGFDKVVYKYDKNKYDKKYLFSFVGSNTHNIRNSVYNIYKNKSDVYFDIKNWSFDLDDYKLNNYIEKSLESYFILAPRGYGKTSFRLYESFSLNTIPVYISDEFYLPYLDTVDWNDFCILIDKNFDLNNLYDYLLEVKNSEKYSKILSNIKNYSKELFSMDYMCKFINSRVKELL